MSKQPIDRLTILFGFFCRPGVTSAGVSEIAKHFAIDKGKVSRMLNSCFDEGYLEKDPSTGRYELGAKVALPGLIFLTARAKSANREGRKLLNVGRGLGAWADLFKDVIVKGGKPETTGTDGEDAA